MKRKYSYEADNKGHEWKTNDYDGGVDIFAFEIGNCNGPMCIKCGYSFCHHCRELPEAECPVKEMKGADNDDPT